jgi:AcrR family transcriptional regulator
MPRRSLPPGVDRRQQILEAALDIFAEHGFDGATTKAIVAKADVTQGLIYFYFASKEDLFYAAFEHQSQHVVLQGLTNILDLDAEPESVITQFVVHVVTVMDEPRNIKLLRIWSQSQSMLAKKGGEKFSAIKSLATPISTELQTYFEEQIKRGKLRPIDAHLTANLLTGSIVSSIIRQALGSGEHVSYSREELASGITQIFLHGLLP